MTTARNSAALLISAIGLALASGAPARVEPLACRQTSDVAEPL
jgi:hypothetical protein